MWVGARVLAWAKRLPAVTRASGPDLAVAFVLDLKAVRHRSSNGCQSVDFHNERFAKVFAIVNLARLNDLPEGTVVTPELLKEYRICRELLDGVKVLGTGELTVKLTVHAHAFSTSAKAKIEAAGGTAEVI